MSRYDKCPVCKTPLTPFEFTPVAEGTIVHCTICGKFSVSERFLMSYGNGLRIPESHIYSGALREHDLNGNTYLLNDTDDLRHSVLIPENPLEQIDKLLLSIERLAKYFGESLSINCNTHFSYAYAKSGDEFHQLLLNAHNQSFIETGGSFPTTSIKLLWRGAGRLAELHNSDVNSNQAFVAMWFDPRMTDLWVNGIQPALEETNYKALRIDKKEHNNKIDDEIIAAIRKSGLVVADVTGHRQGVYFEAGYAMGLKAMGLKIEVIWTCSEDGIKDAHFDTRQYNHIVWSDAEDLKQKLIHRIEATQPFRKNS